MLNLFTKRLAACIQDGLPGDKAWGRMIPAARGLNVTGRGLKKASVLILLYPKNKQLHIILIKRTASPGHHSNQVSFPGGMQESIDRNEEDTALRETMEEIGVNRNDINILGKLSNLQIPISNTEVSPFVGFTNETPDFHPEKSEVNYLIEIEIKTILNPANIKKKTMLLSGDSVEVPYFHLKGEIVWGATAMILAEFIDLVEKVVQDPHVRY